MERRRREETERSPEGSHDLLHDPWGER